MKSTPEGKRLSWRESEHLPSQGASPKCMRCALWEDDLHIAEWGWPLTWGLTSVYWNFSKTPIPVWQEERMIQTPTLLFLAETNFYPTYSCAPCSHPLAQDFLVGYTTTSSRLSVDPQVKKITCSFNISLWSHSKCTWTRTEKAMAPHSSTLAWKIPWMEEPGRLQSMLRVRHDWVTSLSLFTFIHWRRKWQPTPVFLPGESQGWGSLVGCRLWGCTESDTTEVT